MSLNGAGLWTGTKAHLPCSQDSTRTFAGVLPTATHVVLEAQETLLSSSLLLANPSLGLGTIDHLLPSQDSTKVAAGEKCAPTGWL